MTDYQAQQIAELQGLGWTQAGSQHLAGPGRQKGATLYCLTNAAGTRAYVHTAWTQYIA